MPGEKVRLRPHPQSLWALSKELGHEKSSQEVILLMVICTLWNHNSVRLRQGPKTTSPLVLKGYLMSFTDAIRRSSVVINWRDYSQLYLKDLFHFLNKNPQNLSKVNSSEGLDSFCGSLLNSFSKGCLISKPQFLYGCFYVQ